MTRTPLRRAALSCLALAGMSVTLGGCASDRDVLARVGDETITIEQFAEVARSAPAQYEGPPDSVRARLFQDLVDRELLVQGAMREGLHRTPEFQAMGRRLEDQLLREELFRRLLGGPFPVSEGEVRELYRRRGTATRCRLIFTFDERTARQALQDLRGGADFAAVADRYNPPGMVPPGGDLGFLQPGSFLPPLDDLVRTGPLDRIVGPVAAAGEGWFVLRLEGRRPQSQPPFAQERAQLGEMLRQRKQRVAMTRVIDRLRTGWQVEVLPGAPQTMVAKLRRVPEGDAPPGIPTLSPAERAIALARYAGGGYTLGEALDDLLGGGGNRPNLAMLPAVTRWIESQTIERAALAEARKRRLHEEPAFRRRLRDRLNNHLLDAYYQRQVVERIHIAPEDFRRAYERHQSTFARLTAARVVSVTLRDSAAAALLAAQAGHAPSLRDAAAAAAAGGRVREERLAFPAESPVWTQVEGRIAAMRPGEVAGPYAVERGWLLFQLLDKQQDAPPFESLPPGAQGQLQGVATEIKREARLAELTDSLRRVIAPLVVHRDRLQRVPWPPAPTAAPG